MFRILQQRSAAEFTPIDEITLNVLNRIQTAYQNGAEVTGISTGFIDLDRKLSGLQPSDLVLIAARPSMGKTAFVLNIVEHAAVRNGLSCMIFSLEMSKEQLVNRILSMESSVDAQKMRNGDLSSSDFGNIIEAAARIAESKNLVIDDTAGIGIGELRSKWPQAETRARGGSRDYRLPAAHERQRKVRREPPAGNLRHLPQLKGPGPRAAGTCRCALAALPRGGAAPGPQTHALGPPRVRRHRAGRGCGDVPVPRRLLQQGHGTPERGRVIIAKQRNGPIGTVSLVWKPDTTRFVNMAR